jgi:hypothetical protein
MFDEPQIEAKDASQANADAPLESKQEEGKQSPGEPETEVVYPSQALAEGQPQTEVADPFQALAVDEPQNGIVDPFQALAVDEPQTKFVDPFQALAEGEPQVEVMDPFQALAEGEPQTELKELVQPLGVGEVADGVDFVKTDCHVQANTISDPEEAQPHLLMFDEVTQSEVKDEPQTEAEGQAVSDEEFMMAVEDNEEVKLQAPEVKHDDLHLLMFDEPQSAQVQDPFMAVAEGHGLGENGTRGDDVENGVRQPSETEVLNEPQLLIFDGPQNDVKDTMPAEAKSEGESNIVKEEDFLTFEDDEKANPVSEDEEVLPHEAKQTSEFEMEWGEDDEGVEWAAAEVTEAVANHAKVEEASPVVNNVKSSEFEMEWGDDDDEVVWEDSVVENEVAPQTLEESGDVHTSKPSEFEMEWGDDNEVVFAEAGVEKEALQIEDANGDNLFAARDTTNEVHAIAENQTANEQTAKVDNDQAAENEMEWGDEDEVEWGEAGGMEWVESEAVAAVTQEEVVEIVAVEETPLSDSTLELELETQREVIRTAMMLPSAGATNEEHVAPLLAVMLSVLVSIINFNGLPNAPQQQNKGADPAIGRLCAATFVQIGKAAAAAFKLSMASLTAEERATIESAMRAELTGYPANAAAGGSGNVSTKKRGKINFKAFK